MTDDASKYVAIYLNDHLTGSTYALELAGRAARAHQGTELGVSLTGVKADIEADRRALEDIMASLGVTKDRLKQPIAWIAEKLGRLKLNGELLRRSPLSTTLELELLSIGIEGKRLLWLALAESHGESLAATTLTALVARAEDQRARVERHRLETARQTLSGPTSR